MLHRGGSMRAESPVDGISLVCPVCRGVGPDGVFRAAPLGPAGAGLGCPACGAAFPVVDGVPIVLRDTDAWLRDELPTVLAREGLPAEVEARLLRGGGPVARSRARRAAYRASGDGPFQDAARAALAGLSGRVLELGCGTGWHGVPGLLGVDLDWILLGDYPGRRLLADALEPPLPGAAFDAVVALNLLDSCRDPALLLQQMDALLAPGGVLVLASPFAWDAAITPPAAWLDAASVQDFLASRGYSGRVSEHDWVLRHGPRTRTHLATWLCVAQR